MLAVPGSWKSLEELEESITLDELMRVLNKNREIKADSQKFMAQLQGVELQYGPGQEDDDMDPVERIARRAQDRILSQQEEGPTNSDDYDLSQELGITFKSE